MKTRYILLLFVGTFAILPVRAQKETTKGIEWAAARGLEYSIKAGFNIGGTAPVPLPEEIRSIKGYNPRLSMFLEGSITKWFDAHWGMQTGIRLETKGMSTDARVKNYGMEFYMDSPDPLVGRWTGRVKTKVNNTYLTVPVLATYKLTSRWRLQGGPFFSYLIDGDFSGHVFEGYLRENDPTGNKIEFKGDSKATYDFSDDLRKFQWGAQLGAEWKAFKQLTVNANLTWGFKDIFKSNFKTVTFDLFPIYLQLGFGYAF
jgi:hypothetical protein